jgi:ubiquitin-protein ligase E3 C
VNPTLLKIFCPAELQILISGSISGIDVQDWKNNTQYVGGYSSFDPYIMQFWSVVESFSEDERSQLLRFVTSVPRPPSLGFGSLNPSFTIQWMDISSSSEGHLPTAATCFNILKLPRYSNKQVLKEKLLQSITSRAGFEFS